MGGTPHWRRHRVELRSIREKAAIAERRRCERIVEAWNRRPSHDWSPTIGAALKAGYRWLSVYCPGCGQIMTVDLERIDRHPWAGLTSLILSLRCRRCLGIGPLPQLRGLSRFSPDLIQLRRG